MDSFIAVDDNFFPYQRISHRKVRTSEPYDKLNANYAINDIYTSVSPLPEKVFLPPEKVRIWILKYINNYDFIRRISAFLKGPWVVRIFLANNSSFKKGKIRFCIKRRKSINKITLRIIEMLMPHFIWVVQISSIDQYKRMLCTAEIVLDSTASSKENPIIYTRFGNILYYCEKDIPYTDEPIEFEQYTHNLGEFS